MQLWRYDQMEKQFVFLSSSDLSWDVKAADDKALNATR